MPTKNKWKGKENAYQAYLIKKIKGLLPPDDSDVLKNDPNYRQGIPDLVIYNGPRWAYLEVKDSIDASHQPNQDYYIEKAQRNSFGSFIYPENEDEVITDMIDYLTK